MGPLTSIILQMRTLRLADALELSLSLWGPDSPGLPGQQEALGEGWLGCTVCSLWLQGWLIPCSQSLGSDAALSGLQLPHERKGV